MSEVKSEKSWKDYFLSSGIPLENDVKKYLDSKGCISNFEYSYLRRDEVEVEKQFSYDIDASYIKGHNFYELMIECKYRHQSTKWIFLPENYGGPNENDINDFLHPFDHFVPIKFPFRGYFPFELAPLCGKGVEILTSGANEKTIDQAVAQLAYAFAGKVISAIVHQVERLLAGDFVFYHVPIIVTTAELRRLKDDVNIEGIKSARDLDEISNKHDCLVFKNSIGTHLEKFNTEQFQRFLSSSNREKLQEKLGDGDKDLEFLFHLLASTYCPQAIVIANHNSGIEKVFNHIDKISNPSKDTLVSIDDYHSKMESKFREFEKNVKARRDGKTKDPPK